MGLLLRLLTVSAGVVCGLLLAECFVRVFLCHPVYTFEQGMFVPDSHMGYRLARNWIGRHAQPEYSYTIRTNAWGWRGPGPRPTATHRVLVVGDSVAFGQGVQDGKHTCDLVRNHFAEAGRDIDLLNASAPGYCLSNEVAVMEEFLPRYLPSLVVHVFCVNDFGAQATLHVSHGFLTSEADYRPFAKLRCWLNRRSHAFCHMKRIYYRHWRSPDEITRFALVPYRQADVDYAVAAIAHMNALCKRGGAEFAVFISPHPRLLGSQRGWLKALLDGLHARRVSYCHPGQRLIPKQMAKLRYRHDGHWNEAGCRFLYPKLVDMIERKLGIASSRAKPGRFRP